MSISTPRVTMPDLALCTVFLSVAALRRDHVGVRPVAVVGHAIADEVVVQEVEVCVDEPVVGDPDLVGGDPDAE